MNRRKKPRHFTYLDQATAESYLSDLTGVCQKAEALRNARPLMSAVDGGLAPEEQDYKGIGTQRGRRKTKRPSGTHRRLYFGSCMKS